jgi:uncharacterized damage-inducible protein DinB
MSNVLIPALQQIFRRDLLKLRQEIASYTDDEKIWHIEKKISNSAGNLCLHLVGNLNTYIGAELGKSGYVRNRELEFAQKGLSREELTERIEKTMTLVDQALHSLSDDILKTEYPVVVFAEKMTTGFFLIHLASHLNYHLGQINYHRRLLDTKKLNGFSKVYPRAFC